MHECHDCGMYCDCDGEDHDQPQPADCICACDEDASDYDLGDFCDTCGRVSDDCSCGVLAERRDAETAEGE